MKNIKNNTIFAMRKPRNFISNFRHNLLLHYKKGVVSYSYISNELSGFREQKGLHPHFINLTHLLMRKPVNKVNSLCAILLTTSQNYISKITALFLFSNSKRLAI